MCGALRATLAARTLCSSSAAIPDHFAALGVGRSFSLDEAALKAGYLRLMAEHHPDRHTRGTATEQSGSADRSADVTRAFSVLTQPHRRAVHLLELLGAPLVEETNGTALLGVEFLSEIMDKRFEVDDPATTEDRLKELQEENNKAMQAILSDLDTAFSCVDVSGNRVQKNEGGANGSLPAKLEEARILTAKLGYLQRIHDVAIERLAEEEERREH